MAISLIDNLKIQNKKQNVERDSFATILDMVSYSPNYLPNIFHAMCEETGKMYVYNVNNDIDPVLGKWRVLEGSGGGTADVPIEKIKVNGELQTPVNKVVDITVPIVTNDLTDELKSSYDDAVTAKHTHDNKTVLDGITAEKVEAWDKAEENVQSDWNETDNTADGFIKNKPTIPSKVSELENDSNYLSSIPEEYVTETELSAKGYLTEHQDISGKVDKVDGKSLIADTEIARLATVDNYDDTDIKTEIAKKADATSIPSKVSELTNDSNYQTAEQVNSTVTTEIAKVVADAPEDLNTLKEMSDWITGHENDASAMNSAISDNKTAITALQTDKANKSEIPTTVAELTDSADYAKKTDLHSHENKTVLDGITSTKISNWDSAKTHADSAHAPSTAQENVIETVKVNGIALTPSSKAVNIDLSDYAKTTDIPTTLPANGGNADTVNNHTVNSDVPENAVFTDTILEVNDADVSKTTVWSSDKVASEIASAIAGGEVDLSAYQKKNDTGLCTMAQDIVGAINEVKEAVDGKINYDDTEVKADITELQTKAHTHSNTEVLGGITSENIQSWNNKSEFDGNYDTLTNKPALPVKLSDLTNDSGYITNIVDDLLNYYKKSDTYSKEEISKLIGNINKLTSEIVESLPIENISTSTIYLIKDGDTNNYKQYMYISGAWAQLSDTNIDLSGYAKLTDLDTKVDKVTGKTLSTNDFTNVLKSKLDGIAEGANKTVVDAELSTTSLNPVQNAVVTTKINTLANKDGSDATGTWGINISGTAAKATADKNGNDITTTYAKQADFEKIVGNVDIIDYTSQISKNTDIISGMFSTNIRKVGHIVTFVINITVKAVSSAAVVLGTIPKGVRPPANVSYNVLTNKGDACYVYIDSNGKFGIRKISATEFAANDGVRFCANYITEE